MNCPECSYQLSPSAKFCPKCGCANKVNAESAVHRVMGENPVLNPNEDADQARKFCPKCGGECRGSAKFCPQCGYTFDLLSLAESKIENIAQPAVDTAPQAPLPFSENGSRDTTVAGGAASSSMEVVRQDATSIDESLPDVVQDVSLPLDTEAEAAKNTALAAQTDTAKSPETGSATTRTSEMVEAVPAIDDAALHAAQPVIGGSQTGVEDRPSLGQEARPTPVEKTQEPQELHEMPANGTQKSLWLKIGLAFIALLLALGAGTWYVMKGSAPKVLRDVSKEKIEEKPSPQDSREEIPPAQPPQPQKMETLESTEGKPPFENPTTPENSPSAEPPPPLSKGMENKNNQKNATDGGTTKKRTDSPVRRNTGREAIY